MNLLEKISDTRSVKSVVSAYKRYERFTPVVSFVAGFSWDSVTLKRIDLWFDNLIMLGYLFLLGLAIFLVNRTQENRITNSVIIRYQDWYPLAIQFFLGGLFSGYVVLYSKSAALTKNWIFLGLLILVLLGNEFIRDKLTNLKLQFILFFLAVFSFFIFFIPVVVRIMNTPVFLLSGFISLMVTTGFLYLVQKRSTLFSFTRFRNLVLVIAGIYLVLNISWFCNWIPPVPLAMKEAGIYHHADRTADGYKLQFEAGAWYHFWKDSDYTFHYRDKDSVFCFVSVFAPTKLTKQIFHHWQHYSDRLGQWHTTDRMSYKITGGRDGGYRGYTFKKNMQQGKWRIEVETEEGRLLGRVPFTLIASENGRHPLKTIFR